MYAIVEIAGQQFKVEKGRKLYVHRLAGDEGSSLSFDKILLTDNDGQVKVGTPVVEGAAVSATILQERSGIRKQASRRETFRRSGCQSGQYSGSPERYRAQCGRERWHGQGPHAVRSGRRSGYLQEKGKEQIVRLGDSSIVDEPDDYRIEDENPSCAWRKRDFVL